MADDLITKAEVYLFKVGVKKMVVHAVAFLVGSAAIQAALTHYGITVNWDTLQASLLTAVVGGITFLIDYLKVKKGWTWL